MRLCDVMLTPSTKKVKLLNPEVLLRESGSPARAQLMSMPLCRVESFTLGRGC